MSPKIKHLFILLLLFNVDKKVRRGVSTDVLNAVLWPDFSRESAKNNRGVTISNLRSLLRKVDKLKIVFRHDLWMLEFSENVTIDYAEYLRLRDEFYAYGTGNTDTINAILGLISKGQFLQSFDYPWIEPVKISVTEDIISFLTEYSEKLDITAEKGLVKKISDTILQMDNINEKATGLRVRLLLNDGKHSLAKYTLVRFYKEYEKLYGEKYTGSLHTLLDKLKTSQLA